VRLLGPAPKHAVYDEVCTCMTIDRHDRGMHAQMNAVAYFAHVYLGLRATGHIHLVICIHEECCLHSRIRKIVQDAGCVRRIGCIIKGERYSLFTPIHMFRPCCECSAAKAIPSEPQCLYQGIWTLLCQDITVAVFRRMPAYLRLRGDKVSAQRGIRFRAGIHCCYSTSDAPKGDESKDSPLPRHNFPLP
jgi:hypothetical protein